MSKLQLYVGTYCPYCRKVENFIEENNIQGVEIIDVDQRDGAREYLVEKGGKKQVPCLFIDGEPLYESMDIIHYLKSNQ